MRGNVSSAFLVILGFLALGGCVAVREVREVPRAERRVIATDRAPAAIATYSQAIQAGDLLWLAGQIGLDPATRELVPGGIEAETRRALDNCRAVLEAAGFTLEDVVQVQVFLADIADYGKLNEIYAGYFPEKPPARAVIAVAGLPRGARVEILMTAAQTPRLED